MTTPRERPIEEIVEEFCEKFPVRNPDIEPQVKDWLRNTLTEDRQAEFARGVEWAIGEVEKYVSPKEYIKRNSLIDFLTTLRQQLAGGSKPKPKQETKDTVRAFSEQFKAAHGREPSAKELAALL